jgi:hypothetical protein
LNRELGRGVMEKTENGNAEKLKDRTGNGWRVAGEG